MSHTKRKFTKKQIEDLDFEISFFENLVRENPDFTDALIPLGDVYTKRGFYEKGLAVDLKLADLLPLDPTVHYNLACSYSLLGKINLALNTLGKAIKLGYNDIKWMNEDPDLENVRKDTRYQTLIKK